MENFELVFEVSYNCSPPPPPPYRFSRVIVAESPEMAYRVANGMLGEEVNAGDFLAKVVEVRRTNKEPNLACWGDSGDRVWARVLRILNLTPDKDVEFIFDGRQKVGLFRSLKC